MENKINMWDLKSIYDIEKLSINDFLMYMGKNDFEFYTCFDMIYDIVLNLKMINDLFANSSDIAFACIHELFEKIYPIAILLFRTLNRSDLLLEKPRLKKSD